MSAGTQQEQLVVLPRGTGSLVAPEPAVDPLRFHRSMPDYGETPLRAAPHAAARLGVAHVLVKDESARLGMPSFKILGASWAVYRALLELAGSSPGEVPDFAALAELASTMRPLNLSAATDGNHGRAVARMAKLLGFGARVYVPRGTAQARIDGIASEGAEVEVVDGGYDDTVRRSAADASDTCLVISDTSWPGYESVPRWVIDGYQTIFGEINTVVVSGAAPRPDVVAIPIGVGALAAAAVRHYWAEPETRPVLVGVEPVSADCVLESVEAGEIISLTDPQDSIMAGLNCATPSLVAWPLVSRGMDAYVSIRDERVPDAMRILAQDGIVAGETGAAALAGLIAVAESGDELPRFGPDACVLVLVTEGATDPEAYERLVGK